mgnify:CR=1 FL=1
MLNQAKTAISRHDLHQALNELRGVLTLHREIGVEEYPAGPGLIRFLNSSEEKEQPGGHARPRQGSEKTARPDGGRPGSADLKSLKELEERLRQCPRCPRREGAHTVFGEGDPQAELMLIGTSIGAVEDGAGSPIQGEAGALLDRMLAAIKLQRRQVYLTTLVKCRPVPKEEGEEPEGKAMVEEQIKECLPHLLQQIAAIKPKIICTMGPLPAQALLRSRQTIFQLRGRFHKFQGALLLPTLAPEQLLDNPEFKKAAWEDLQLIQRKLTTKR